MKYGARNTIDVKVTSIKKGDVMSQISFEVLPPAKMGSVLTTDSLNELDIKEGDQLKLIIKAINVLPVKE